MAADAAAVAAAVSAYLVRVDERSGGPVARWRCSAELWGYDGAARLAEVSCAGAYDGVQSGMSAPVRVDGAAVDFPEDGAGFAESLVELWGEDLAAAYLDRSR